jgi:virginiamycin B lyase
MRARSAAPWLLVPCLLVGALAGSGCGAKQRASAAEQADIQLEAGDYVSLALSDDDTVWAADSYGSITRVDPSGKVTDFALPEDEQPELDFPGDIVEGPDGAMWFTTTLTVGRIDGQGEITSSDVRSWPSAITTGEGGLWFATLPFATSSEDGYHVQRINTAGVITASIKLAAPRSDFSVDGIVVGPDGALWFTQSSYGEAGDAPDAIGRVTVDGHYTSWQLPNSRSTPTGITAGPDGALWFTELKGRRIGRITTTGAITEFALPPDLIPTAITDARDDALWFTTDTCLGRMTTKGEVTTWPVANAKELVDIAAAPDGSFWLLDRSGHALRHFTPPQPLGASEGECRPPTLVVEAGSTRATLVYKRLDVLSNGEDFFTDIRIRIARDGKEVFAEAVPERPPGGYSYGVYGYAQSVSARDLDGDGEPEVMLELNWNGTHCCFWSRIYRFDERRGTYVAGTHVWGNAAASPKLRDLDDDGRPEFVSADDRFSELTGYAGAMRPIQVWSYERGEFREVTRRHPKAIEKDAADLWRWYLAHRGKDTVRYVLAAWAADQYMLGRVTAVDRVFAEALERGELAPRDWESEDAAEYLGTVRAFLRKTGYMTQ